MSDWVCICPELCERFPKDSPYGEIWEKVKVVREKRDTLKEIMKERRSLLRKITKLKNFEKSIIQNRTTTTTSGSVLTSSEDKKKEGENEDQKEKVKEEEGKEEEGKEEEGKEEEGKEEGKAKESEKESEKEKEKEKEKEETKNEGEQEEEEEEVDENDEGYEEDDEGDDDEDEEDDEEDEEEEAENDENLPLYNKDYFANAVKCIEAAMDPKEWELNGKRFNKLWCISMCQGVKEKVIEVVRDIAQTENPWALYNLGMMICTRVIQNSGETFKDGLCYLSKASSLGCPGAYNSLGVFFQTGFSGLKWDPKKAVSLYMSAIRLNCASAMCNLGEMLCEGVPGVIEKQEKTGMDLIRKAARAGNARALYMLGIAYFHSKYGMIKDRKKAAPLIFLGAEAGDPSAQDMLGTLFYVGSFFKKNFEEGFYFFSLSALNNSSAGMRDLGLAYVEGHAVPKDLVKGLFWYNMAAMRGDEPSKKVVIALERYFPDEYQDALDKSLEMIKELQKRLDGDDHGDDHGETKKEN